jgi:hypothetical protein
MTMMANNARVGLTRHKISDRWRERVWLHVKGRSYRKLERGAASGSLYFAWLDVELAAVRNSNQ